MKKKFEKWGASVLKPVKPAIYPKLSKTEKRLYDSIVEEPGHHIKHYYDRDGKRKRKAMQKLINKRLIKVVYCPELDIDVIFPAFYTEKQVDNFFRVKFSEKKQEKLEQLARSVKFADDRSKALVASMDYMTVSALLDDVTWMSFYRRAVLKARKLDKNRIQLTFEKSADDIAPPGYNDYKSDVTTNLKLVDYSVKHNWKYDRKEDRFRCSLQFKAVFIYNPIWGAMRRIRRIYRGR